MKLPNFKNWKFIKGRTRVVLLTTRFAFKVPNFFNWKMFLKGLQQSMFERENYRVSQFLMPLLFGCPGGWLNIMPRAKDIFNTDKDPDLLKYFESVLVSYQCNELEGVSVIDIIETAEPANFGWYKGHVVCIDYGNGKNTGLNTFVIKENIEKARHKDLNLCLVIEKLASYYCAVIIPEYRYLQLRSRDTIAQKQYLRTLLIDDDIHSCTGPSPANVHDKIVRMISSIGDESLLNYLKSDKVLDKVKSLQSAHVEDLTETSQPI